MEADFNIKLGVKTIGKELRQVVRKMKRNFHSTGKTTYWSTDLKQTTCLLDFIISTKVYQNFNAIEENFDVYSDHSDVYLIPSERIIKKRNKTEFTNKTTHLTSLKKKFENKINLHVLLKTIEQLEIVTDNFNRAIQPLTWNNNNMHMHKFAGINYPKEIRELV